MKKLMTLMMVVAIATTSFAGTLKLDTKNSSLEWIGKKAKGEHRGMISFKSGSIEMDGDAINSGSFIVDMKSLTCTDLKGEWGDKLVGHLGTADFLDVANHPTAEMNIKTSAKNSDGTHSVTADLDFRGQKVEIKFNVSLSDKKAQATLDLQQALWGITYTGKEDNPIRDTFQLVANIAFK